MLSTVIGQFIDSATFVLVAFSRNDAGAPDGPGRDFGMGDHGRLGDRGAPFDAAVAAGFEASRRASIISTSARILTRCFFDAAFVRISK
ncbi:MAG TPA: hypothetical protein VIY49_12405 [Bryobacteraceae bacterium]